MRHAVLNLVVSKIIEDEYKEESARKMFSYPESTKSLILTHFYETY
jgi:hypothetical protein